MPLAERFIPHSACGFAEPAIECGEYCENESADQDVMEMRDHEIRISELPVPSICRKHAAGQSSNEELKQKCDAKEQRGGEADFPPPHRAQPVEYLDSRGYAYRHGGGSREGVGVGS